ncbi:hypothetical protein KFZ76_21065 [Methylovulum psychrotolerans]|uniref:hypothetical protein n=1 Tax=Methylovulum psychrotolerans TaxID=1704499 RepID=UPI001BFF5D73|nr:hypothetical protein [Methylovulum psychrotolerans]MBT9100198.1 hypothetical protein [Methylovulum psychrotolerans]
MKSFIKILVGSPWLLAMNLSVAQADIYAYNDSIVSGWSDWSWDTTTLVTNDTLLKKSGTASAHVNIAKAWNGFALHWDTGGVNLSSLSALKFDINPGGNVAKVAALSVTLQNDTGLSNAAKLSAFATPPLAANTWSSITIPVSSLGGLALVNRLNLQDGLGQGGVIFNVDNVVLVSAALAGGCQALAVDSGAANAGKPINGFLNDQYTWSDSACKPRNVALALNDASKGGNAKQFTYTLPNGTIRTVNPSSNGAAGFGYVVAHLSNPSFAAAYGKDDSPLGSGSGATSNKLFVGNHHAIHEYTLNYVRYGLTQAALTNLSIEPWTWIYGPADPNRQYVTVYNMPVRIHWMLATGRNYPVWSVTFDLSQIPNHAVDSDFRAPYGDMNVEGGTGADVVGGVGWGDKYVFASAGKPFTMNNAWDYSQLNQGAPYDYLWTSSTDAEMGLAGTQLIANQNAGGYNNYQAQVWRGKTSANMGQLCINDQGAGPGYNHKMPCTSDWAYQLVQYSVANAAQTTSNKRLAWGADWGSLGNGSFIGINGYGVHGWPKVSYSTYIVLDPHSAKPTQAIAKQAKTISLTSLTTSIGTVRTKGVAGVGRSDNQTYSPVGYSPIYGTWELDAANNNVLLYFGVSNTAPTTLDMPIIVAHNYTLVTPPVQITLDGVALVADTDYFVSVRPAQSELWVTLNKKLAGKHSIQISN